MPENKLTDNEIIKALECCINWKREGDCAKCPAYESKMLCVKQLRILALDLINRLQAENERLDSLCDKLGIGNDAKYERICVLEEELETAKAEIERLSDRNHKCIYLSDDETTEYCVDGPCPKFKTEAQIKAEAYKECIEKVRNLAVGIHPCSDELRVFDSDLDNILKGLVGEDNAKEKE